MKMIFEGDKYVQTILGKKQIDENAVYKWSQFTVFHTCDGADYLYNNFTKVIYRLEGESFTYDPDEHMSGADIAADKALAELVAGSFLVPEGKDEDEIYVSFCKISRAMKMKRNGFSMYTILPTTACNARCVYCFEQGMKFVTMKDDTVEQTIEFIKKSHNPKEPVRFSWFGGEPLVGEKIIDRICAGMREAGIEFRSSMVTNSALITENTIKKMKNDWNLTSMQITLDGVEEEYNRRKNYIFQYDSAYWHVLSRIKLVNENDISINIRVNVDNDNINGVLEMADDLKNFIPNPKLVRIYLAPLFDLQASTGAGDIWEKSFKVMAELEKKGFDVAYHTTISKARYHYCMADAPYTAIVVSPEGKLHNCEHIGDIPPYGDVWTGVTNTELVKKLYSVEPVQETCRGCFALPYCTTFTGCDHVRVDCRYAARMNMERALDRAIRRLSKNPESPDAPDENENDNENC